MATLRTPGAPAPDPYGAQAFDMASSTAPNQSASMAASPAPDAGTNDPFAAAGGGLYYGATGQWVPKNNSSAITGAQNAAGQTGWDGSASSPTPGPAAPTGNPASPQGTPSAPPLPSPVSPYSGQPLPAVPLAGGGPTNPQTGQGQTPQVPQPVVAGPQTDNTNLGNMVQSYIGSLLDKNGQVDQNVITSRADQARGTLNQARSGQLDQDQAALADRGLIGSGAEGSALTRLDQNTASQYGSALSGILGNEYQNADNRMMGALTTGAGVSETDANRIIDAYNASTGRTGTMGELGLQNKAIDTQADLGNRGLDLQSQLGNKGLDLQSILGNKSIDSQSQLGNKGLDIQQILGQEGIDLSGTALNEDYSKFLGNLGLNRDSLAYQEQSGGTSQILQALALMFGGANTSAGGHY